MLLVLFAHFYGHSLQNCANDCGISAWLGKAFCQDPSLRFFEQYLEASKAQAFAGKTPSESIGKAEKKPFFPKCPCCKTGNLHRIAVFDQRGPPAWYLGGSQNVSSYIS